MALSTPQSGQDSRENWRFIVAQAREIDALKRKLFTLQAQVDQLRKNNQAARFLHPFCIYYFPTRLREERPEDEDPADDWRRFRVRSGMIGTIEEDQVQGTDRVANPDEEDYGDGGEDILVPEDTERFYIFIQILPGEVAAIIRSAVDPTAEIPGDGDLDDGDPGWENFPDADGIHFLIGWVDTKTHAEEKRAVVRQLIRTDILPGVPITQCDGDGPKTYYVSGIKVQDTAEEE